jgi:hypothetical protein
MMLYLIASTDGTGTVINAAVASTNCASVCLHVALSELSRGVQRADGVPVLNTATAASTADTVHVQ